MAQQPPNFLLLLDNFIIPRLHDPSLCRVADIEKLIGYERRLICRWLLESTGKTIKQYIHTLRYRIAAQRLRNDAEVKVGEVRKYVGIVSADSFARTFNNMFGEPPNTYKKLFALLDGDHGNVVWKGGVYELCRNCGSISVLSSGGKRPLPL